MKRNGKGKLLGFLREFIDSLDDAASGNRDVTCPDFQAVFRIGEAQCLEGCFVILKGFPLPHGDKVGNTTVEIVLHGNNLAYHFRRGKVAG